jgi:SWIM zinc finger
MAREGASQKATRYLAEGRLTVTRVDSEHVEARCRGSGAVYRVSWNASEGWTCSCEARGRCAHLLALQSVTVRPEAVSGSVPGPYVHAP